MLLNVEGWYMTNSNIIDAIKESSSLGRPQNQSVVDKLISSNWCEEEDLSTTYQVLQKSDLDIVMIFFQLPYQIKLPAKWFQIKSDYGNPYIRFRPIGTVHNVLNSSGNFMKSPRQNFSGYETFENAALPNDYYGLLIRTQVTISYQLWNPRKLWYSDYINCLNNESLFNSLIVDSSESWLKDKRPLSAATYELDLARRLKRQTLLTMKDFIKAYSIACQDPYAHVVDSLNSFIMMVKTGRLVVPEPGSSMIVQFAKPFVYEDYSQNLSLLKSALLLNRKPSVYEKYLLEAVRQIESGSTNLAVVYAVMILDWFANEIIYDRLISKISSSLQGTPEIAKLAIDRVWGTPDGSKDWKTRGPNNR